MSMFDSIVCKYPLPVAGANALHYHTKSGECTGLDYEIREDGTLWVDLRKTVVEKGADFGFRIYVKHFGWTQMSDFSGEFEFYAYAHPDASGWIEWCACFEHGRLVGVKLVEHDEGMASS